MSVISTCLRESVTVNSGERQSDMKPARVEIDGFKYHIQVVKEEIFQNV